MVADLAQRDRARLCATAGRPHALKIGPRFAPADDKLQVKESLKGKRATANITGRSNLPRKYGPKGLAMSWRSWQSFENYSFNRWNTDARQPAQR